MPGEFVDVVIRASNRARETPYAWRVDIATALGSVNLRKHTALGTSINVVILAAHEGHAFANVRGQGALLSGGCVEVDADKNAGRGHFSSLIPR
jgi:hypothetical protein